MRLNLNINLDLERPYPRHIPVEQGSDITLALKVLHKGVEQTLDTQKIAIYGRNNDGTILEQLSDITVIDRVITVKLYNGFTQVAGEVDMTLEVRDTDGTVYTPKFTLYVQDGITGQESVQATQEANALRQVQEQANKLKKDITIIEQDEKDRIAQERDRIHNEAERLKAERERLHAEELRVDEYNQLVGDFNSTTNQLNQDFSQLSQEVKAYPNKAYVDNEIANTKEEFRLADDALKQAIDTSLSLKADKSYVDSEISKVNTTVNTKADKSYVDDELAKVNTSITKAHTDIATKANKSDVSNALTFLDEKVDTKADETYVDSEIVKVKNIAEVNQNELEQARVALDNTEFDSLNERLTYDLDKLQEPDAIHIEINNGGFIDGTEDNTTVSFGEIEGRTFENLIPTGKTTGIGYQPGTGLAGLFFYDYLLNANHFEDNQEYTLVIQEPTGTVKYAYLVGETKSLINGKAVFTPKTNGVIKAPNPIHFYPTTALTKDIAEYIARTVKVILLKGNYMNVDIPYNLSTGKSSMGEKEGGLTFLTHDTNMFDGKVIDGDLASTPDSEMGETHTMNRGGSISTLDLANDLYLVPSSVKGQTLCNLVKDGITNTTIELSHNSGFTQMLKPIVKDHVYTVQIIVKQVFNAPLSLQMRGHKQSDGLVATIVDQLFLGITSPGTYRATFTATDNFTDFFLGIQISTPNAIVQLDHHVTLLLGDYGNDSIPDKVPDGFTSTFEKEKKLELKVTGKNILDLNKLVKVAPSVYEIDKGDLLVKSWAHEYTDDYIKQIIRNSAGKTLNIKTKAVLEKFRTDGNPNEFRIWYYYINSSGVKSIGTFVTSLPANAKEGDEIDINVSRVIEGSLVSFESLLFYNLGGDPVGVVPTSIVRYKDFIISIGDTEYEPYQEDVQTLTLTEPLRSVGDVRDDLEYQRIKCVYPFVPKGTGVASEFTHPDMFGIYFLSSEWDNTISDKSVEFDKIPRIEYANQINSNYLCYTVNSGGATIIGIPKSLITGWNDTLSNSEKITKANAFITSLNLTMLYQLATPVKQNYTILKSHTLSNTTYVSINAEIEPYKTFDIRQVYTNDRTDFQRCRPNQPLVISHDNQLYDSNIFFYDIGKNLIERRVVATTVAPANAYYYKVVLYSDMDYDTLQVEEGDSISPYEPYRETVIQTDIVLKQGDKFVDNEIIRADGSIEYHPMIVSDSYTSRTHVWITNDIAPSKVTLHYEQGIRQIAQRHEQQISDLRTQLSVATNNINKLLELIGTNLIEGGTR